MSDIIIEDNEYQIVNEDGTDINFDYPENPLKEKWQKLYPPNQRYDDGSDCYGYSCIFCDKCPYGSNWKVPDEDKEVWEQFMNQIYEYHKIHNPSLYEKIKNTVSNENTRWGD